MKNLLVDGRVRDFFYIENDLVDRDDLDVFEKMVYIVLARHVNSSTGTCFPSYPTIAAKAGISERKAISTVKSLIKKSLLLKEVRKETGKNSNATNIYTILSAKVVHDMHQGGAQYAPGVVHDMHPNNTNTNNTKLTTSSTPPKDDGQAEEKEIEEEVKQVSKQIEDVLGTKVTDEKVKELIQKKGLQKVKYYLEHFHEFTQAQQINSKGGFFVKAVLGEFPLPVQSKSGAAAGPGHKPANMGNFQQRGADYYKDVLISKGLYEDTKKEAAENTDSAEVNV